ncbi:MAG: hypothetical protein ACXVEE_37455 [Polyangiales bacterium]
MIHAVVALAEVTAAVSQEETIDDPTSQKAATVTAPAPDVNVDVWQRTAVDTSWTRDPLAPALSEDVARSWLRTSFSTHGGTRLRYSLDVRLDLEARVKKGFERPTYLYDAVPMAAWVELPIGEKSRLRVGEQIVSWGRMDLASAADVLERRDLRAGPSIDPTWLRLPTPTVRLDVNVCRCFDLSLAWSVVSQPHRLELAGTSWAVLGPGILGTVNGREALNRIATATDASTFVRVQDAFVQASSAAARIEGGDLATRGTFHLGGADLAFTYGFVRSKIPVVIADRALLDVLTVGNLASALNLVSALEEGRPLLTTEYPRYHQFALDLEGTAGPFVLSWELGFTPSRALFVPDPSSLPRRVDSGLAQGGLRLQYTHGDDFAFVSEADYFVPTKHEPFVVLDHGLFAILANARKTIDKHFFELGAVATTSGPSLFVSTRYGYELNDAWTVGLGGSFFPKLRTSQNPDKITLADVQVGRDYIEAFVRFRR